MDAYTEKTITNGNRKLKLKKIGNSNKKQFLQFKATKASKWERLNNFSGKKNITEQ